MCYIKYCPILSLKQITKKLIVTVLFPLFGQKVKKHDKKKKFSYLIENNEQAIRRIQH